jgi:uncharacterized membrane protein YkgB
MMNNKFDDVVHLVVYILSKLFGIVLMGGSILVINNLWSSNVGTLTGRVFTTIGFVAIFLGGAVVFNAIKKKSNN